MSKKNEYVMYLEELDQDFKENEIKELKGLVKMLFRIWLDYMTYSDMVEFIKRNCAKYYLRVGAISESEYEEYMKNYVK